MPSRNITPKKDKICSSGCLVAKPAKKPEQGVKCPRCDSMNTKFCYYNNHSLTQPRYFCKGCRRYWTKGGALRTIPFGGGYRRRKFSKLSNNKIETETDYSTAVNGLELFPGFDMNYQLTTPTSVLSNVSMGSQELNFTLSSIESMSSINQDLYWKSQQQRLAVLFGEQNYDNTQKEDTSFTSQFPLQNELTQKSYDDVAYYCSAREGYNGNLSTEWLYESFYESVEPVAVNDCGNNRGIIEGASSWINGIQGWSDFNQCGLIMP